MRPTYTSSTELVYYITRTNLNGVFYFVGEVLERADGNGLLGRVLRRRVGLSEVGDDDLHVALGAQGARFQ